MTEILGYAFMQKALAVSILGSIACGIIGTLVTVNRMSALAGSIAHASFGGLGLAYVAGFNPLIGATGFALLSALGVAAVSSRSRRRTDTAMAAIWAAGMATGLVLVKLSGTYAANLMSWLFGSLLAVSDSDILFAVILNAILILAIVLFYKEFLAISYDRQFSRLQGVPVNFFRGLFLVLTALTAVLLMRVTGLIMVIALLALPSAIAEMFTRSLWRMMVMASVLAALFSTGGLFLAWWLDLPPGAVIILIASAAFGLALLIEKLRSLKN